MVRIMVRDLRKAYDNAVSMGESQFTIQGLVLVTKYAKYVLEFATTIKHLKENEYMDIIPKGDR